MKKLLSVLSILVIMLLTGCATTSQLCLVPEAENSVICKLSKKVKTTPEAISQTLKVANIIAMETNVYTAQQADKFIDRLIEEVQNMQNLGSEVTYMNIVKYIDGEFSLLPPKVQVVFEVMNTEGLLSQTIEMPLTQYDFELLLRHLQKQKELIKIYLR